MASQKQRQTTAPCHPKDNDTEDSMKKNVSSLPQLQAN